MRELIYLVNQAVNNGLLSNIISDFELSEGIYLRFDNIDTIKEDDILIINNKKEAVKDELYDWFRNRSFYDGLMFNDANKCLESKKRTLGVNAHGFIVKYSSSLKNDKVTFEESMYNHFSKIKEMNDHLDIDIDYEVDTYLKLIKYIYSNYKEIIDKKPDIKLHFYRNNASEEDFKISYMKYINESIFSKKDMLKFDEVEYGANPFQNTYNRKKPSLCPSNGIRKMPYVISSEEGMGAVYLSKMTYKQLNLLVNSSFDTEYEIIWGDKSKLSSFNQIKSSNMKTDYIESNFLLNFDYNAELKAYSQKEIINKLDSKSLFNGVIKDIIYKYINSNKDLSDVVKVNSKKITDISLIQEIISNRDILSAYALNNKVDISNVFRNICKNIYIYRLKQCETLDDLNNLKFAFMDVINILANTDKKGEFKSMPKRVNELLNKFNSQISEENIEINTEEDFYFLAGQTIRYLMGLKESKNQKADILANVSVKNSSTIKEDLIETYQRYSHAIPAYSLAPINLVYQALMLFDEQCKKNKVKNELWFYYQAGLIGKNLFYRKKEILGGNENENE